MAAPRRYGLAELQAATGNFSRQLGAGGFGAVFHGELPPGAGGPPVQVAVKKLTQEAGPGTAAGVPAAAQFAAEVHGMAAYAGRPHLLPVLGYCDEAGTDIRQSCVVYPLMLGGDLERRLRRAEAGEEPLLWPDRVRIFREISLGLVDLHDPATGNGQLYHRDVKTANVLLDGQGAAHLGDFGLARALPGLSASGGGGTAGRTHVSTANLIGTHQYMAPEYLSDGEISNKTDVYSCGACSLPSMYATPSYVLLPSELVPSSTVVCLYRGGRVGTADWQALPAGR